MIKTNLNVFDFKLIRYLVSRPPLRKISLRFWKSQFFALY